MLVVNDDADLLLEREIEEPLDLPDVVIRSLGHILGKFFPTGVEISVEAFEPVIAPKEVSVLKAVLAEFHLGSIVELGRNKKGTQ